MDQQPEGNVIDNAIMAILGRMVTTAKFRTAIDGAIDKIVNLVVEKAHTMDRNALALFLCNEARALIGVDPVSRPMMATQMNEASRPDAEAAGNHGIYCGIVRRRLTRDLMRKKGITRFAAVALVDEHIADEQILSASAAHGIAAAAIVDSSIWDWIKANWPQILQVVFSLLGLLLMFAEEPA